MKQKYIDFIREAESSNEYWIETIISDFTEEVCALMDKQGITRIELANKINSSPAYITKVLRGNVNFTLATMTKLARALGTVVRVHLAPEDVVVRWEDVNLSTDSKFDVFIRSENYIEAEIRPIVVIADSLNTVTSPPLYGENFKQDMNDKVA